jgi:hypothetical protein
LRACNGGIIDEKDLKICHSDGLKWHDIHNEFHNSQFSLSSNMRVITATTSKTAMLVLLKGEIYIV